MIVHKSYQVVSSVFTSVASFILPRLEHASHWVGSQCSVYECCLNVLMDLHVLWYGRYTYYMQYWPHIKQDRQCTHNVTQRRVRVTIVAVKKQ